MKLAAGKVDCVAVELAKGVVVLHVPSDEGECGMTGVVKGVGTLIPTVVALPVMFPVMGIQVGEDTLVGVEPEDIHVSFRLEGSGTVTGEIVPFKETSTVDTVGLVALPVLSAVHVVFRPGLVGVADPAPVRVTFHPEAVDNGTEVLKPD